MFDADYEFLDDMIDFKNFIYGGIIFICWLY